MTPSLTDIPIIGSETRAKRLLQSCFEDLLRDKTLGSNPSERFKAKDWERVSGFRIDRLVRRASINRMGPFGILTRQGYKAAFVYGRQQRRFQNRFNEVKYRTHVMRHPGWQGTSVLIAESRESDRSRGHSVGIWAFVPTQEDLFDARVYRDLFNGTGPDFLTPAGNLKEIAHGWSWDSENAHGRRSVGGRDWSSVELRVHRFHGELLPLLDLPQNCRLYSVTRHARYY